jgi:hypothetical protein
MQTMCYCFWRQGGVHWNSGVLLLLELGSKYLGSHGQSGCRGGRGTLGSSSHLPAGQHTQGPPDGREGGWEVGGRDYN